MTRIVAITQARTTSTRLPRKVLRKVCGRTLLEWHVERMRRCAAFTEVVLATTTNASDDEIVALARTLDVRCFRGSEHDVLSRYYGAARDASAELVVRVTSDSPLWDPSTGARVVDLLKSAPGADFANNIEPRTFPRGLDTEVFWMDVLERMQRMSPPAPCPEREHVTDLAYGPRAHLFVKVHVADKEDHSALRWCVDTPEDFAVIEALMSGVPDPLADYNTYLALALAHPEIGAINANVVQKTV